MIRVLLLTLVVLAGADAATVSELVTGITLSVSPDGRYLASVQNPAWAFGGNIGRPLESVRLGAGTDRIGKYDEISFQYQYGGPRQGAIRVYQQKPILLFTLKLLEAGDNSGPFPSLRTYPPGLYHLTFADWNYSFNESTTDGPLVEFDSAAHTFILSPASNFMVASTSYGFDQGVITGVNSEIRSLPAGFTHQTILVVDKGINQAFDTWGHALTDLAGKARPDNNADITLSHVGYWTDHGASYYYHFEPKLGYEGTLRAIRDEFLKKGVPLGYLQLDSWFYPKGPMASWQATHNGIYEYVAAPDLFPNGLKGFQEQLGIPLVTHARWIDAISPYHGEYRLSGNVAVDPRYWNSLMSYLHESGVAAYEQDWLSSYAQTNFNLTDPGAFLDNMALSAARKRLTLQYCMPTARHYLQSSKYSNLTTIRASTDRFGPDRWDGFLYGSRLASALGLWPWSDVFMSSETGNLLLATLSAGPVGVGDRIGSVNASNLLRAVRNDGMIIKSDTPLVPVDQTLINDAQGLQTPMVAATHTNFGSVSVVYVLAYPRGSNTTVSFQLGSLGLKGGVFVYSYFAHTSKIMDASEVFTESITGGYAYYILAAIGESGIGLIGDAGHFVSLGRQRITSVVDDGVLEVAVAFAPSEGSRMIYGYSSARPAVTALKGDTGALSYDPSTHLFIVSISDGGDGSAIVRMSAERSQSGSAGYR